MSLWLFNIYLETLPFSLSSSSYGYYRRLKEINLSQIYLKLSQVLFQNTSQYGIILELYGNEMC